MRLQQDLHLGQVRLALLSVAQEAEQPSQVPVGQKVVNAAQVGVSLLRTDVLQVLSEESEGGVALQGLQTGGGEAHTFTPTAALSAPTGNQSEAGSRLLQPITARSGEGAGPGGHHIFAHNR